jgi:hypothetical protein
MKLGFGFGFGFSQGGAGFPAAFVVPNTPRGTLFYDSFGNQFRARTNTAGGFNDIMKTYFDPTTAGGLQDMSTDGLVLLDSVDGTFNLIDDSSGSDPAGWIRNATYYTAIYNALTSPANTSDYIIIVSGINDATAGSPITKTTYKQALAKLKEFVQADFVNVQCAFLAPLPRSDYGSSVDSIFNTVREAQNEYVLEDTWFKRLPDTYDMDLRDTAHPTDEEYDTRYAQRFADAIAAVFGKRSLTGVYGPLVTSAAFYGSYMLLDVAQDGGTDFETIPALAEKTLALRIGSTDYKPSSVSRVSATQLKAEFENIGLLDGTIASAVIGHGTMSELSQTSAEVIKDNATYARPLRSGVVAVTNNDPLWNIHDLNLDLNAKTAVKTYSSGALVSSLVDRENKTWTAVGTTREPTYDGTAFGGQGALTSADDTTFLISTTTFTASNTGFGGLVFDVPATVANNKYLLTFGLSNAGSNLISFYMTSAGILNFTQNQALGIQVLSGDIRNTKNVLIWNFRSLSEVDFYLNNNAVITIDPRDSLISFNQISLFNRTSTETGGTTGFKIGRCFHRNTAHNEGTDGSIASILAGLKSLYGTV